jgi:hypothetical protein
MRITIAGLDQAPIKFKHLWGRYVLGFKPWTHCERSFHAQKAVSIVPGMKDGTYELDASHDLFYLCGVGQPDAASRGKAQSRKFSNVHLAVRPKVGSVASVGSLYGVQFTLTDAEEIPIQPLADDFMGLSDVHARCKNFQFGFQMFEVEKVGEQAARTIVRQLRSGTTAT